MDTLKYSKEGPQMYCLCSEIDKEGLKVFISHGLILFLVFDFVTAVSGICYQFIPPVFVWSPLCNHLLYHLDSTPCTNPLSALKFISITSTQEYKRIRTFHNWVSLNFVLLHLSNWIKISYVTKSFVEIETRTLSLLLYLLGHTAISDFFVVLRIHMHHELLSFSNCFVNAGWI